MKPRLFNYEKKMRLLNQMERKKKIAQFNKLRIQQLQQPLTINIKNHFTFEKNRKIKEVLNKRELLAPPDKKEPKVPAHLDLASRFARGIIQDDDASSVISDLTDPFSVSPADKGQQRQMRNVREGQLLGVEDTEVKFGKSGRYDKDVSLDPFEYETQFNDTITTPNSEVSPQISGSADSGVDSMPFVEEIVGDGYMIEDSSFGSHIIDSSFGSPEKSFDKYIHLYRSPAGKGDFDIGYDADDSNSVATKKKDRVKIQLTGNKYIL